MKNSPLNGIERLEVLDKDAPNESDRQRILLVYLIKPLGNATITVDNVQIQGGERIRDIQVTEVVTFPGGQVVRVHVDRWGDFSTYTLQIVQGNAPPNWLDPILAAINFSFKVECPSDFDCESEPSCPPTASPEPDINYLAKDFASFRQLMLDRLAVLMPQGVEQNPASLEMALVELLAHVGDHLSYQQDAIATEAYLETARRRTSVRRHARLVDYFMHDGCNARTWVHLTIEGQAEVKAGTPVLTRIMDELAAIPAEPSRYERTLQQQPVIFETMADITLYEAHNQLNFYTWGAQECCLPSGSTHATLEGSLPHLKVGDVLIFEEVLGPRTGQREDADPTHRWAVRLTQVTPAVDPIGGQFQATSTQLAVDVTEITWADADALPFPLCLSARTASTHGEQYLDAVSVALGNIVLADHGVTVADEFIGTVPSPTLFRIPATVWGDRCQPVLPEPMLPHFRPTLREQPLTQAEIYRSDQPASIALQQRASEAEPAIRLTSELGDDTLSWSPEPDLLRSDLQNTNFVVESEADGIAYIRFGDNRYGLQPSPGTRFTATYRVGNGVQGNAGADALAHVVTDISSIIGVRNPLPAKGGAEPESIETARQSAPFAFRVQERAVTLEDYATVAERHPEVQRAAATFRWTGSWRTVFITIDRRGGRPIDEPFSDAMRTYLEQFRLAGYDLKIDAPRFASLEIDLLVCVQANYFRSDVKAALLQAFSHRIQPDGQRGFFHPDNFTFGQSVYLSQLYAIAQSIEGVASAQIIRFQRQGVPDDKPLADGVLSLGRLEIARLENDPDFPEHGVLRLTMEGGK